VGLETIHERVMALTGWLLDSLTSLRHRSGRPLVKLHGPRSLIARGGTVTMTFFDCEGRALDDRRIEELANHRGISIRTGCFCNPGAGEIAHGLGPEIMRSFFTSSTALSFQELRREMQARFGRDVSAVRLSVGIASNFADVDAFIRFAMRLLDHTAEEVGEVEVTDPVCSTGRDSA
jgi:selenocysteine lyase/cysteine desulfurase